MGGGERPLPPALEKPAPLSSSLHLSVRPAAHCGRATPSVAAAAPSSLRLLVLLLEMRPPRKHTMRRRRCRSSAGKKGGRGVSLSRSDTREGETLQQTPHHPILPPSLPPPDSPMLPSPVSSMRNTSADGCQTGNSVSTKASPVGVRQSEGRQHQVAQCNNLHILSNYQPLLNAVRRQRADAASFIPLRPAGDREYCSLPSVMTLTYSRRIGDTQL